MPLPRLLISAVLLSSFAALAGPRTDLGSAQQVLASLSPRFEPNRGQFDARVSFASRSADATLAVLQDGAQLNLPGGSLRLTLAGGHPAAVAEGMDPLRSRSNYILGNQPGQWKFGIPHYARVRIRAAYPGVDLIYYFTGQKLEYDIVVSPGADPSAVRLRFSGVRSTQLDKDGSLVFDLGGRQVKQFRPVAYQEDGSRRVPVPADYRLSASGEVGLAIGEYDRRRTLVIDPIIFAGYLQGNGNDVVKAVTLDANGNLWLTGWSGGVIWQLPAQNDPYQAKAAGLKDVFIAEVGFDPSTGQGTLLYWTYLGEASGDEEGNAIAVDPSTGLVYVAGYTKSGAFPTVGTTLQSGLTGTSDAFLSVINPSQSGADSLMYSSYYGGDQDDVANALVLMPDGTVVIGGYTSSSTIPGSDGNVVQSYNRGGWDAFVARINPWIDTPLVYGTFFGGDRTDVLTGLALDAAGNLWMAGYTLSDDFPYTDGAYQTVLHSLGDLFLVKLNLDTPGLEGLLYGTYIGGGDLDVASRMAIDAKGGIWLTGYTLSSDFPTTPNAYQTASPGGISGFLLRFDPSLPAGQALTYSTYVGWGVADISYALALMPGGAVALTGYTMSPNFPLIGSTWDVTPKIRLTDAFLAVLDPSKSGAGALVYSALCGGALLDTATAMTADAGGNLYVAGTTTSWDVPVTDGSTRLGGPGVLSSFLLKVNPGLPSSGTPSQ